MQGRDEGDSGDLGQPGDDLQDADSSRDIRDVPGHRRHIASRGHRRAQRGHRNAECLADTRARASRNHDQRGSTEGGQRQ